MWSRSESDERIQKAKASVKKLNAHLMDVARSSADNYYLASPVTGGGVTVDRFSQLFLMARAQDKTRRARELGELVWQLSLRTRGSSKRERL